MKEVRMRKEEGRISEERSEYGMGIILLDWLHFQSW